MTIKSYQNVLIFFNSRGSLKEEERLRAPTSPTAKPVSYPHPVNPNFKLWDLPGLGTALFPEVKTYYERLELADKYDAFLLFIKGSLTDNSKRLAIRLECSGKPFVFIRSCIDSDVDSEKATKKEAFDESEMEDAIRQDILNKASEDLYTISGEEIFLISIVKPEKWDFERLNGTILYDLVDRRPQTCSKMADFYARFRIAKLDLTTNRAKYGTDNDKGNSCLSTHCRKTAYHFL